MIGRLRDQAAKVIDRGPVCECDDPRCFEPLGVSWQEFGLLTKRRTSLVCKGHQTKLADAEDCKPYVAKDLGKILVVKYA